MYHLLHSALSSGGVKWKKCRLCVAGIVKPFMSFKIKFIYGIISKWFCHWLKNGVGERGINYYSRNEVTVEITFFFAAADICYLFAKRK